VNEYRTRFDWWSLALAAAAAIILWMMIHQ